MIGDRQKLKRDLRVDFLRGLALLTIFVDHVPHNRWASLTQQNFGFSDAAELFVVLAGYSAVLAYARYFDGIRDGLGLRRIASRIGTIYVFHIGTLVAVMLALSLLATIFDVSEQIARLRLEPILHGDAAAITSFFLLLDHLTYFDILPLYIALLAAFPVLFVLLRRSFALAFAASAGLWLFVQATHFNLPTSNGEGWHFNPFAWQFLLLLGMMAAVAVRQKTLPRSPFLTALAISILVLSFIVRAPWTNWPLHLGVPLIDAAAYKDWTIKTYLGPARLLHIVAFGYLILVLVPPRAAWLKRPLARSVADVGASSLEIFCLGIVLSIVGATITASLGRTALIESWVTGAGVAVILYVGAEITRRVREQKRAKSAASKSLSSSAFTAGPRAGTAVPDTAHGTKSTSNGAHELS